MTIKIALIEFDYHAEVLRNTLHILDQSDIKVHVFTTEKIWDQVNWQEKMYFDLSLQNKDQSLSNYLSKHRSKIDQYDIILFNTVASNFKKWSELNLTKPTLLRIHNANAYFNSLAASYKPHFSPFYIWKDSSHFLRKTVGELESHFRKKFVDQVDHFVFPSENITEYATKTYSLPTDRTWTLPFGYWKEKKDYPKNQSNLFKICIIGRVDQRNRDYEVVVNAVTNLLPFLKASGKQLELVLLGKADSSYGKRITEELNKIHSKQFSSVTYDKFVPQFEFDKHIVDSDFFIIPTKIETRYTVYQEEYGYTKISGSINDVIKYHKPALITHDYPLDGEMASLFESFNNSEELSQKIQSWINNKTYQELDFPRILNIYQLSEIQKKYRDTFEKILSIR